MAKSYEPSEVRKRLEKEIESGNPIIIGSAGNGLMAKLDEERVPFYDLEKEEVLFESIRNNLNDSIKLKELDTDINDPEFAIRIAETLDEMINQ